jgi:hypothetical protein
MRFHCERTGEPIFAGKSKVIKVRQDKDGGRKSVRVQEDGSLGQDAIGHVDIRLLAELRKRNGGL